jgi:thiamine-monophosphate kinase
MVEELRSLGEFGLVALFEGAGAGPRPEVVVGMGDDCAVLDLGGPARLVWTTDMLLERIHFERAWCGPEELGWKSMAVNLSDVAAMGAEPVAALLALGLPPDLSVDWVRAFRDGLAASARAYGLALVGGDTVAARRDVALCLTVLGRAPAGQVVLRSGGRAGDLLLVAGSLGDSAAGLRLLRGAGAGLGDEHRRALLRAHLRPEPQLALGRALAAAGLARAMIDVSDGLVQDLGHLARASGLGAELEAEALPVSEAARALAAREGADPHAWALAGGEDYRLLFAVDPVRLEEARGVCLGQGLEPAVLGRLTEGAGVRVRRAGQPLELGAGGFDHFATLGGTSCEG